MESSTLPAAPTRDRADHAAPSGADLDVLFDLSGTGRTATITVTGELDPSSVDRLRQACVIACKHVEEVDIDLAGVSYCGAAGLRLLSEMDEEARAHGVSCRFRRPSRPVRLVIEACGMDQHPRFG